MPVHAELVPPHHGIRPADILDPDGDRPAWFCDRTEVDALVLATAQHIAAQPARARAELAGYELTFPIFTVDHNRAVVVLKHWQVWPTHRTDGLVGGQDGGGVALLYERRDRAWVAMPALDLFAFDGEYAVP